MPLFGKIHVNPQSGGLGNLVWKGLRRTYFPGEREAFRHFFEGFFQRGVQIERPPGVFPKRAVEDFLEQPSLAGKMSENFETMPGSFLGGIQKNNSFKMLTIKFSQSGI